LKKLRTIITGIVFLMVMLPSVFAAVTGKISGVVEGGLDGKPIIGATVRVMGTNMATKTDEDGEYYLINIPVGKYNIAVTHVGFDTLTQTDVRVLLDLTTPVDFYVNEVTVNLDQNMVVYASAPIIQRDLTSSRVTFTEERLKNLPNITSIQSILSNYPGVVFDRDDAMHIRGGRAGQVSYYYDGFTIQDPFTASAGMRIVPSALEELSLTSGGYTAEYGEALSGVVNAVTREGGPEYKGGIRLYEGATHKYDVNTAKWGKLAANNNHSGSYNFSGPIPGISSKKMTFFSAGEYIRDDSYLPFNWDIAYTGIAKFTAHPMPRLKLKANLTYSKRDGAIYYHRDVNDVSYDFNLDGLPLWNRKAYLAGVTGNYNVSDNAFWSLSFSRFETKTTSGPSHLIGNHWSEWPGYSEDADGLYNGTIHEDTYGASVDQTSAMEVAGFTSGNDYDPTYSYRRSAYNSITSSIVAQLNKSNQLKAGFEYRNYSTDWDFKQFYNDRPYGEQYSNRPTYASFFIEDKLEYETVVINLGLRYHYRNADIAYNYTPENIVATYKDADSKARLSPRLGVSFPISEKSIIHFNYGTYYQAPKFSHLYTNLHGETGSGLPLFGNPDLEPEETISYELGVDHLIGNNIRIDATAFYKDIEDLVTTRKMDSKGSELMTRFTNDDYGTVTGLDLALELLPISTYFSGSVSYGFMKASGIGSNSYEPYYTYITSTTDTLPPLTEYAMDFDQRHTVTAVLDYRVPDDWNANLFGLNIPGAWGLSMVGYYGSGLPYTRTDVDGNRLGDRNEERLPAVYSVDMRLNKNFLMGKAAKVLTFFVEVDNLFNRKNVLDVYSRTGSPDDDGQGGEPSLTLDADDISKFNYLFDHDPTNFSPPRTVRSGFEFNF